MEKKYQIFISSTYTDLRDARDKVRDAILSMYHFPVGMELFGAASAEQWEIIKETIDSSDYYVLIIGHRYGSIITDGEDAGISYTEKEFRYAKTSGVPILVFIIDDSVPVTPDKIESNTEAREKLDAFIAETKTGRTVVWWKNVDDLAQKVTSSLHNEFGRTKRPGWIRADSEKNTKEIKTSDISPEVIQRITEMAVPRWEAFKGQDFEPSPVIRGQRLSHDAMIMLAYASLDGEIMLKTSLIGTSVEAGQWDFVMEGSPREVARWEGAIDELLTLGYIKQTDWKPKTYKLTSDGYKVADIVISENDINLETPPDKYLEG